SGALGRVRCVLSPAARARARVRPAARDAVRYRPERRRCGARRRGAVRAGGANGARGLFARALPGTVRGRGSGAPGVRCGLGGWGGHGPSGHLARPMTVPGPGLSVVIASVNGMPYLAKCLDALAERCPEAEVVVADWTDEATRAHV